MFLPKLTLKLSFSNLPTILLITFLSSSLKLLDGHITLH